MEPYGYHAGSVEQRKGISIRSQGNFSSEGHKQDLEEDEVNMGILENLSKLAFCVRNERAQRSVVLTATFILTKFPKFINDLFQ